MTLLAEKGGQGTHALEVSGWLGKVWNSSYRKWERMLKKATKKDHQHHQIPEGEGIKGKVLKEIKPCQQTWKCSGSNLYSGCHLLYQSVLSSPSTEQVTLLVSGRSWIRTQRTETQLHNLFRACRAEMADQESKGVWDIGPQKSGSSDRESAPCWIQKV